MHQIELEMQNEELRQAQVELEAERAHYIDFYDLAPVGYCTVSETGLILEVNLTAATWLGVARGALVKQPFARLILSDDQDIHYRHRKLLLATGKPQEYQLRMVKQDGTIFWVHLLATAVQDPSTSSRQDEKGALLSRIVISDITERKQSEETLRVSEERFRKLFERHSAIKLVLDAETGNIIDANEAAAQFYGWTIKELKKMRIQQINTLSPEAVKSELEKAAASRCNRFEFRHRRVDGSVRDVEVFSNKIEIAGKDILHSIIHDITDRKEAEQELRESEERFRSSVENAAAGYFFIDREGLFKTVNAAWLLMHKYDSPAEILGRHFSVTQVDSDQSRANKIVKRLLAGEIFPQGEFTRRCKDDSIAWHTFSINPVRQAGKVVGLEGFLIDITATKRAEEEKAKLEALNRQLQKNESLGRMAGAIAHHFNNQLQAVTGNLEMAVEDLPRDDQSITTIKRAMQAADKAAEVSKMMLTYLGHVTGAHEPLDLSEICRRTLPIIQVAIPKNVGLETDLQSPGPSISANVNQIQQVVINLVTNAWEAVGESQGAVRLTVKTVSPAEISTLRRFPIDWQQQDKDYACLEIADEGCGIEDEDIEKLFDPFFSSKFTGRGLGLSVVLGIVRTHDGVITVDCIKGQRSVFRVFIPMLAEEVLHQPDKAVEPPLIQATGTVLLVEDNELVHKMTEAMLMRLGFTVLAAYDGVEAVEVFRQHQDEVRCVLCDLTMPRMDGWETLTTLRRLVQGIPIILVSGYSEEQVMEGDHPERPQAFLHKPYQMEQLSKAIRQALAGEKGR